MPKRRERAMNSLAAAPSRLEAQSPAVPPRAGLRAAYLTVLAWAFGLFNTVRVFAYLPTIWAIYQTGDSSQHSLWTWLTWLGANATMAAWLYEKDGQRTSGPMWVNAANAVMCAAAVVLIVAYRV
jgi:hypothetical protein